MELILLLFISIASIYYQSAPTLYYYDLAEVSSDRLNHANKVLDVLVISPRFDEICFLH